MVQPTLNSEQQDDDRDPDPCPSEDEELFDAPEAESMEEAINKFVDGLESQERCGFDDIHRLIKHLPVPVTKSPLSPFFWLETRLQRSLTCSASARIQASRTAVLTQQLPTEGGAAMSKRLTCGCGVLLVASPAWVV